MTLNVKVGDEVLVTLDPVLWLRVAGPVFVDEHGTERVPFVSRDSTSSPLALTVMTSLVLRIRKAEEVVARELMR